MKEVKNLYSESYKTSTKEIEDEANEKIDCSWTGRITVVKLSLLHKAIYIFNVILIKIPMAVFREQE